MSSKDRRKKNFENISMKTISQRKKIWRRRKKSQPKLRTRRTREN